MQAPNIVAEKLNHLIAILDDESQGYLTAAQYARNKESELLFEKLSYQRSDFVQQIKNIVRSVGTITYSKGGFLSLLHRTWKDMYYRLKSRDWDIVKTCCVMGEKFTISYYESILNDPLMPATVKNILSEQLSNIRESLHQFQPVQTEALPLETVSKKTTITTDNADTILFLIAYLKQVAEDFAMIADEIEDKNLKNTFVAIAEENNQFATELNTQIKQYGLTGASVQVPELLDYPPGQEAATTSKKNELLNICDRSEYIFLKLYTDALKEFLSFKHLTDLMAYQYNSIRTGFLKLRMLNSIRFSH